MNTSTSISWGVAAICLLIFVIIGLTMLKVISAILGRVFSRSVAGDLPAKSKLIFPALMVVLCVGLVAVKGSRVRSQVVADEALVVNQTVQDVMEDLSQARQQIREVVHNTPIVVVLDEPSAPSEPSTPSQPSASPEVAATETIQSQESTESKADQNPSTTVSADAVQEESKNSSETKAPASTTPAAESTTTSDQPATATESASVHLSAEERAKRAREVGGLIRSLLSPGGIPTEPAATDPSRKGVEGAESDGGGVMVFALTPEDATQMFSPESLSQLKSGLPKEVQAAFALVPLTAPMDPAVAPVKPFLAASSLQALADKLVTLLDPLKGETSANDPAAVGNSTTGVLAGPSLEPAWVRKPDGGRVTVESRPVFEGGDPEKALADAVNEAYRQHALEHFESLAPAIRSQLNRVELKLDQETAKLCIVEKYVRNERGVFGSEGEKPFQIAYALVQFPETVDIATDKQLRLSMQNDRLLALGLAVGFAWLGVVSACFGIRTWTRRTGFRRLYTFPLFGVAVTFLLSTIAIVGATTIGDGPHVSSSDSKPIVISVPSV